MVFGEHGGDDLLIFFGLKRAGGIDDAAAGAHRAQCGGENRPLALCVTRQIFQAQAMANFWIAAQGSGAAAGNVGKDKIERRFFIERGCIGEATFDAAGISGEALAQLGKPPLARFAGQNASLRIALGENESFSAGRGAGIEDTSYLLVEISGTRGQLSDQLRSFILNAHAALAIRCGWGDVAGDDGAGGGEDGRRVRGSRPRRRQIRVFGGGVREADGSGRLRLAVAADRARSLEAVEARPALDEPGGVGMGQREFGGGSLRG